MPDGVMGFKKVGGAGSCNVLTHSANFRQNFNGQLKICDRRNYVWLKNFFNFAFIFQIGVYFLNENFWTKNIFCQFSIIFPTGHSAIDDTPLPLYKFNINFMTWIRIQFTVLLLNCIAVSGSKLVFYVSQLYVN